MTTRAILWCGAVKGRDTQLVIDPGKSAKDKRRSMLAIDGREVLPSGDQTAQVNGLELAFRAALALGAHARDAHACVCDDLLPREFVTAHRPATLEALRHVVRSLASGAKEDDSVLFIAINHGEQARGLLTSAVVDELDDNAPRFLTPADLDACLDAFPGRQALIVAACCAGQFLALGTRPQRVVLTSCGPDDVYWIRKEEGACSTFLAELFAAW